MKKLIMMWSNKGGVGKSTFASMLAYTLRKKGKQVAVYDGDLRNASTFVTLSKFDANGNLVEKSDAMKNCELYDLRSDDEVAGIQGRGALINSLADGPEIVIHDLPGNAMKDISNILGENKPLSHFAKTVSKRYGYEIILVHVIDTRSEGAISVEEAITAFGDDNNVKHVVVLNKKETSNLRNFSFWFGFKDATGNEHGGTARKMLADKGGMEIEFDSLTVVARDKISLFRLNYEDVYNSRLLMATEREQFATFEDSFEENTEALIEMIAG